MTTTSRTQPGTVAAQPIHAPGRWLLGAWSLLAYAAGSVALLLLAGFLADLPPGPGVDDAPSGSAAAAVLRDVLLVLVFGVSHSVLARPAVKRFLARAVPRPAERSTYVLVAAVALGGLVLGWAPVGGTLWDVHGPARGVLLALYAAGWALALASTFAVSHTDLFGLRQAWSVVRRRPYEAPALRSGGLHAHVRHPLMAGLLVAFWAAPTMTVGHLLLAAGLTGYVAVGIVLEERDLLAAFGVGYREYRATTPALLPRLGRR